jgi:hypothetical protein
MVLKSFVHRVNDENVCGVLVSRCPRIRTKIPNLSGKSLAFPWETPVLRSGEVETGSTLH